MTMLKGWNDAHNAAFQNDVLTFDHGLRDTGLFTDDALSALLDNHPQHLLDVCSREKSPDPKFPGRLRTGDPRGCTGKELIAAAKKGYIWINMREAMLVHPEYKAILDDMYADFSAATGCRILNPRGGILITSPIARTPYHFDKTETVLWHIRGKKRIYVYPLEDKFIPDTTFEQNLINPIDDDLPYYAEFDESARILDLKEGQAITWPLNSPHRVENSEFCVSVTTEYSTAESGIKNAVMVANATWREKFGTGSTYSQQSKTGRVIRSVFGRSLQKLGKGASISTPDLVTFKIDVNSPDGIVDTEPFERNF